MRLNVYLPSQVMFQAAIQKLRAYSPQGSFTLLPRHIDYISALAAGIVAIETKQEETLYLATDEGILIKQGEQVSISTRNAILNHDLGKIRTALYEEFRQRDRREERAREALFRLQADFIQHFTEIEEQRK